MDKKITYYIIAGVVLVAVIIIVIVMQNPGNKPVVLPGDGKTATPQVTKSETQLTNEDIAKQLNLSAGELPLRVTMDDNGQSYSATPGKNLVLMLGTDYKWDITSSDNNVLAKRDVNVSDGRIQAIYQLVGAGNAVLDATGTCKAKVACASPNATFKFTVEGVISENETPEDLVK